MGSIDKTNETCKYEVQVFSGEFKIKEPLRADTASHLGCYMLKRPLTADELSSFIRSNLDSSRDYCNKTEVFDTEEEALACFESLKKECIINEYTSNGVFDAEWIVISESLYDKDGECVEIKGLYYDDYFPSLELEEIEDPDDVVARRIGENLSIYRKEAGISQQSLADKLATTRQQIRKYELGEQDMSVIRLLELAEAIGIEPAKLIDFE